MNCVRAGDIYMNYVCAGYIYNYVRAGYIYNYVRVAATDYAHLIYTLKRTEWHSESSPVIAFGGSYGGMLAAWLRMKYPAAVDGSIAGSAPILAFKGLPAGL